MRLALLFVIALTAPSLGADEPKKEKDPVGLIKTYVGHEGAVRGVEFSTDGKKIYSASDDKTIRVWDLVNEKKHAVIAQKLASATTLIANVEKPAKALLSDGAGSNDKLTLWDSATGRSLRTFGPIQGAKSLCVSQDGKLVGCGTANGKVMVWEYSTGRLIATLDPKQGHVHATAISPDGKNVVSSADDEGGLRMWEIATGKMVWRDKPKEKRGHIMCIKFAPDGKTLICGTQDHLVRLIDWTGKAEPVELKGNASQVHSLDVSKDGSLLVTGGEDKTVRVWDLNTNKELHKFEHDGEVFRVRFSPDGKRIASASKDESVKLWGLGKE